MTSPGRWSKKLRNAKDEFTEQLCARLERVTIENRNALDVIACYDSPDAFHFVDPPYVNSDCGHYEDTFNALGLTVEEINSDKRLLHGLRKATKEYLKHCEDY